MGLPAYVLDAKLVLCDLDVEKVMHPECDGLLEHIGLSGYIVE